MNLAPPYLRALDLDDEADERAIRRAYAKRLKLIDQEAEPGKFQALRGSFEQALAWSARKAHAQRERAAEIEGLEIRRPEPAPVRTGDAPRPGATTEPAPASPAAPPLPASPHNAPHVTKTIGRPLARSERDEAPPPRPLPVPLGAPLDASTANDRTPPTPPAVPPLARKAPLAPHGGANSSRTPDAAPAPAPRLDARPVSAPVPPDSPPVAAPMPPLRPNKPPPSPANDTPPPLRRQAAPPTSPPPAAPIGAPLPARAAEPPKPTPTPQSQGEAVFTVFAGLLARGLRDEAAVTRTLRIALDDPRLVNLDARGFFEANVAGLLGRGWRPGHELLFKAAGDEFGWAEDSRRLRAFGPVGALIDAAVREQTIQRNQDPVQSRLEQNLMRRLRSDEEAGPDYLVAVMPQLRTLVERYPNLLALVTSQANVKAWIAQWQQLPEHRRNPPSPAAVAPKPAPAPKGTKPGRSKSPLTAILFVVLALTGLIGKISSWSTPSNPPATPSPPAWVAGTTVTLPQAPQGIVRVNGSDPRTQAELETRQSQAEATLRRVLNEGTPQVGVPPRAVQAPSRFASPAAVDLRPAAAAPATKSAYDLTNHDAALSTPSFLPLSTRAQPSVTEASPRGFLQQTPSTRPSPDEPAQ